LKSFTSNGNEKRSAKVNKIRVICIISMMDIFLFVLTQKETKKSRLYIPRLRTTLHSTVCTPTRKRPLRRTELKQGFDYVPFCFVLKRDGRNAEYRYPPKKINLPFLKRIQADFE
jgi:hypothetical protein